MFLMDGNTGQYITPRKVEAQGCPKRFVLIVEENQPYKIKVSISPGAWDREVNTYTWYEVELLIDGQHITRRFIEKPGHGGEMEHTFDKDPAGRSFIFGSRHDGTRAGYDHIEDSDEVGQIVVRFRRARSISLAEQESMRRKRQRRNYDFHKDNEHKLREAQKKKMDLDTKLKKSTMRTTFGGSTREPRRRRGGFGSAPPATVVDQLDVVAECSTMYDNAAAFERRGWINPLMDESFREYFPGRDWEAELREYARNQQIDHGFCDLTGEAPQWQASRSTGIVKNEGMSRSRAIQL